MTIKELRAKRAAKLKEARGLVDGAADGTLTAEQQTQFDAAMTEADTLQNQIEQQERLEEAERSLGTPDPVRTIETGTPTGTEARAGQDRAREARMAHNTLRMLHGVTTRNQGLIQEAQRELAREGWYGQEVQQRAAGDYYSTLVDADGAVLLPTTVATEVERIGNVYGVARKICSVFTHIVGTFKAPAATGTVIASAVAEGGAISSSKRAFQAVALNPKKWAVIIPWTYEANLEAGPQILADAQFAIGLAFARSEDDALFNGDGSGNYNSINGVFSANRAGTGSYQLGATKTSFDDFGADDVFMIRRALPAVLRSMGSYVFHPDMEPKLRTLKDANGQYLFAYNTDTGVTTLGGRPVEYTEVLPDITDDAADTVFGAFGAFKMVKIALGQGMTSEELREGTVKDADTGADINLATQDIRALKVRQFMDMNMNFEQAIVKIKTAAE